MGGETELGTAAAETEPTLFAAKAKDLGALRDAVVDAASVGTGLWISYLLALFYFAIAAGAVTHRDLLLENPVKSPFLEVELPLKAFFILGPLVFLIVHTYVLLHFVMLAGKIGVFHLELQSQISDDDARARLRRQLPSNIFVQFLSGPPEVRHGIVGFLLKLVAWISLVAGPIALLILFQLQFLPYHSEWITMWQRIAVVIDIALLWILWPSIARGETTWLGWSDFRRVKVGALVLASFLPVLLVVTIATFPGEWLEEHLRSFPVTPTHWPTLEASSGQAETVAKNQGIFAELKLRGAAALGSMGWTSPHELLVAGTVVNYVTGKPQSLWSNVLVLPRFEARDRVKFDEAEGKIAVSSNALSLRGRSLEGAVLVAANLRRADFTGARLTGANFSGADLRKAKFECDVMQNTKELSRASRSLSDFLDMEEPTICTQLHGAIFFAAKLQAASFVGAQLQRANFDFAELQGANFMGAELYQARLAGAQLRGANLAGAPQHGADLSFAQLEGADLGDAELQAADLLHAQLQGANLDNAQLQGANLDSTQLQGANLDNAQLQGANLDSTQLEGASLDHAQLQAALLSETQLQGASLVGTQLQGALLSKVLVWRTTPPSNATEVVILDPELGPKYSGLDCHKDACEWSKTSYAALKSLIENSIPAGPRRHRASRQIATLEEPPYVAHAGSTKAWTDLADKSARSAGSYVETRAKVFKEIGCAAEGAPYVMRGLVKQLELMGGLVKQGGELSDDHLLQEVATAFLDEARCPGARGLPKKYKAALQEIRDQGHPASSGPIISAQ